MFIWKPNLQDPAIFSGDIVDTKILHFDGPKLLVQRPFVV